MTAAAFFYDQTLRSNGAGLSVAGLDHNLETLEEARVRMTISADAGSFVAGGETPGPTDPHRLAPDSSVEGRLWDVQFAGP